MKNKGSKWAYIGISCLLLATLVRACAPEYDQTKAEYTNNQKPAYNYTEYFDQIDELQEELNETKEAENGKSK